MQRMQKVLSFLVRLCNQNSQFISHYKHADTDDGLSLELKKYSFIKLAPLDLSLVF